MSESKSILVTGGTGFLGSHLCKRLMHEGHRVICVDNNYTGSLDNVRDLLDNPRFTFIEHDIINPLKIFSLLKFSLVISFLITKIGKSSIFSYVVYLLLHFKHLHFQ